MKFYLDTSVFGGYFDQEFEEDTKALFEFIKHNDVKVLYSNVTVEELEGAPFRVKKILQDLKEVEHIQVTEDILMLAQLYIEHRALPPKCFNDAQHIALSSFHGVSALVSWNFNHIANFKRIKAYNVVNLQQGYPLINIYSPKQMRENDEI